MAANSTSDKKSSNSNITTTHKILIAGFCLVIVIIIVIGILIYQTLQKPTSLETYSNGNNFVIDESNITEISDKIASTVSDSMFEVNMNTVWNFPDGNSPSSNAVIGNSNSNKYNFAFDVILSGEEEPIYTSTIIPVGSQLNEVILERVLEKGTYDAVCTYHILDNDGNENNTTQVNIKINIEN